MEVSMYRNFNPKDWENEKVVMHCATYAEAFDFCIYYNSCSLGNSPFHLFLTDWHEDKEKTCYNFNNGMYSSYDYYKEKGYIILEWSDFMNERPIKLLQTDDIVVLRNREVMRYTTFNKNGVFVNYADYLDLTKNYNNNLQIKNENGSKFDVMEIRRPDYPYQFIERNWKDAPLIWEREEPVEMTLEEICKALGKDIKIVKSKENK